MRTQPKQPAPAPEISQAVAGELLALLQESADAIKDLKRLCGIVTIGRGSCIESRARWAIAATKREA